MKPVFVAATWVVVINIAAAQEPAPPASRAATPEALRAEIEALKDAQVPWRRIAWKSCLLEGLQEARTQKKPVLVDAFNGEPYGRC